VRAAEKSAFCARQSAEPFNVVVVQLQSRVISGGSETSKATSSREEDHHERTSASSLGESRRQQSSLLPAEPLPRWRGDQCSEEPPGAWSCTKVTASSENSSRCRESQAVWQGSPVAYHRGERPDGRSGGESCKHKEFLSEQAVQPPEGQRTSDKSSASHS
jgi:hypothetical protein